MRITENLQKSPWLFLVPVWRFQYFRPLLQNPNLILMSSFPNNHYWAYTFLNPWALILNGIYDHLATKNTYKYFDFQWIQSVILYALLTGPSKWMELEKYDDFVSNYWQVPCKLWWTEMQTKYLFAYHCTLYRGHCSMWKNVARIIYYCGSVQFSPYL